MNTFLEELMGREILANPYPSRFVQNELTIIDSGRSWDLRSCYVPLERTPIVAATLTGTVYKENVAIQTFYVDEDGVFRFSDIGEQSDVRAISEFSSLNLNTGELVIQWNGKPGRNQLVLSYEWHCEFDWDWDREPELDKKHVVWSRDGF